MNLARPNQTFDGFLFHPEFGNEVVSGKIFVDRHCLRFQSGTVSAEIPMEVVEVGIEEKGDRVYFSDPTQPELKIFTDDQSILGHPAIKHTERVREQITSVLGRRELLRAVRLTLYFLGGCVVATWLGSVVISAMVRTLAARVPMSWEQKTGAEEIEKLRKRGALVDDSNEVAQLAAVAAPLIRVLPPERRDVKFYILNDSDPNAFALPGGYVVVTTGMLQFTDKPEDLLGVLAHELAHVTRRHAIRHKIAAAGPLLIFGVFLHSRSGAGNLLALGSGLMIYQGFSQEYETEADDFGWKYLVAANIDPRGMIQIFQKLEASEGPLALHSVVPEAFASHPALAKRIARLESKWKKLGRKSGFLELQPVTWPKPKTDGDPFIFLRRH